jgi:hypothetical protein
METISNIGGLTAGVKITVYVQGFFGISAIEGKFVRVEARTSEKFVHANSVSADVVIVRKGSRKEEFLCSDRFYFWAIVSGWGHATPSSDLTPTGDACMQGKHPSFSPLYVEEFLSALGTRPVLAKFQKKALTLVG